MGGGVSLAVLRSAYRSAPCERSGDANCGVSSKALES